MQIDLFERDSPNGFIVKATELAQAFISVRALTGGRIEGGTLIPSSPSGRNGDTCRLGGHLEMGSKFRAASEAV